MELWIRSQENENVRPILLKVTSIELGEYDEYFCLVAENLYNIGIYNTKKRALEVLDEIQKLLMPTYLISNISKEDGLKLQDQIAFGTSIIQTKEDSKLEQINGSIVYKMPKE